MQEKSKAPLTRSLVLIGGGHAHVHVLKTLGMQPTRQTIQEKGVEITLIARDIETPYSGMLPGMVAGHYTRDDIHIDLARLCAWSGVNLVHTSADRIEDDGGKGAVHCSDGRPPIRYDVLSIDVGISPDLGTGDAREWVNVTPVKPISQFCDRLRGMKDRLMDSADVYTAEKPFLLAVVGGGAGGLEIALSLQYSLKRLFQQPEALRVMLLTKGDSFLPTHSQKLRKIFSKVLKERRIELILHAEVIGVTPPAPDSTLSTFILSESSKHDNPIPITFHEALTCTSAKAPSWIKYSTPFVTDKRGFLTIQSTYQSLSHPHVFAAGDCATMPSHPRPKSGVYAVRAGPPLLHNILASLFKHKSIQRHTPQKHALALISTGDKYAVFSRGSLVFQGACLWKIKDRIDSKFMKKYQDLPSMTPSPTPPPRSSPSHHDQLIRSLVSSPMRCGGCGAKIGSNTVSRVLHALRTRQLQRQPSSDTHFVSVQYDDAAVIPVPPEYRSNTAALVQTIDFFRSFITDPYVFGQIAAVHALSDCHAMAVQPYTALALAVLPYSDLESITESTLLSMLSGATDVLQEERCALVGGHTCEGAELSLGFSVHGFVSDPAKVLRKRGGCVGDKIIITKPLGTGALFAAHMRAQCRAEHLQQALEKMRCSNGPAGVIAANSTGVHACTDVTGFGFIGHLLEMLLSNDEDSSLPPIAAEIDIQSVPFYDGAVLAVADGIHSTLYPDNVRARRAVTDHARALQRYPTKYPLLYDPQTAGGLLFFVSEDTYLEFLEKLNSTESDNKCRGVVIGEIVEFPMATEQNGGAVIAQNDDNVCVVGSCGKDTGQRIAICCDGFRGSHRQNGSSP